MRNGAPFSKPRVRLLSDTPGDALPYLGAAYNLLYKVRQYCEATGAPVFSMSRTLENGVVVTAAVFGGEEVVSAAPPGYGGVSIEREPRKRKTARVFANFYAVPSSKTHTGGYTPQHPNHPDTAYPGPVSVWREYNQDDTQPDAAPQDTASELSELTPAHATNYQPGVMTWFSPLIKENDMPVVVSWRAQNYRGGRPGELVERLKFSLFAGDPAAPYPPGREFAADNAGRSTLLWVNGRVYDTKVVVWGAALKKTEEGMEVYVFTRGVLRKGLIKKIDYGLESEPTELTLTQVGTFAGFQRMWQAPRFNASCTKAVCLVDYIVGPTWSDSDYTDLVELDIPSLSPTVVHRGQAVVTGASYRTATTASGDFFRAEGGAWDYESDQFSDETTTYTTCLCADYKGDRLVHLTAVTTYVRQPVQSSRYAASTGGGPTYTNPVYLGGPVVNGRADYEFTNGGAKGTSLTIASSKGLYSTNIKITHSDMGTVFSDVFAYSDGASESGSASSTLTYGGTSVWNCTYPAAGDRVLVDSTNSTSTHAGTAEYTQRPVASAPEVYAPCPLLANADLRFDSFVVGAFTPSRDLSGGYDTRSYTGEGYLYMYAVGFDPAARWSMRTFGDSGAANSAARDYVREEYRAAYALYVLGKRQVDWAGLVTPPHVKNNLLYDNAATGSEPATTMGRAFPPPAEGGWYVGANSTSVSTSSSRATQTRPTHPAFFPEAVGNIFTDGASQLLSHIPSFESCRFAFSPDGKYGYVGVRPHKMYNSAGAEVPQQSYEVFVVDGKIEPIPAQKYAPGDGSTLAGAVFFGASEKTEREFEEG